MIKDFFRRLFCFHGKDKVWQAIRIEYDGDTVLRCTRCGATKYVPLRKQK